jgi:hypothetical protein
MVRRRLRGFLIMLPLVAALLVGFAACVSVSRAANAATPSAQSGLIYTYDNSEPLSTGTHTSGVVSATAGVATLPLEGARIARTPDATSGFAAEAGGGGGKALWGFWSDYDKVTVGDREYADINGRLYTQHAVERMTPSGFGNAAGGVAGRSISPNYVEDVLDNPESVTPVKGPDGEARLSYVSGSVQVITEDGSVVTVITR